VQSWDTANKATELSDFSVCTTWGVKGKELFLLGLFRRRLEYPALKRAVREQQSLFGANEVLIEDKASGTQLIQELITDGCHGVTRYQPTCDKIMRLHAQTAMIENGFVYIPETAPWLDEYLHELNLPQGQARRSGRLDRSVSRLVQEAFPGPGHLRILPHASRAPSEPREPGTISGSPACPTRHGVRVYLLASDHQCRPGRHHRNVCR